MSEIKFNGTEMSSKLASVRSTYQALSDKITEIDTESSKQTIYNEELGLYRKVNRAKIIGMEVGSDFIEGNAIDAMVFTKESSEYLPSGTKDIVDVVLDRGNAAAFERHFKLSECNTFEDLKNYGNNFYNL